MIAMPARRTVSTVVLPAAIADVNGDGSIDIVTSTNFGTFVFFNNVRPRIRVASSAR